MPALDLDNVLARLAQTPPIWWVIWIGLLLMTIALLALMRTRWGQSQPLKKCLALSILAHLLMAGYATTVQIVHNTIGPGPATSGIKVSSVRHEGGAPSARQGGTAVRSVDAFAETSPEGIAAPSMDRAASAVDAEIAPLANTSAQPLVAAGLPDDSQSTAIVEPASELSPSEEAARQASPESATPLDDAPAAQRAERATTNIDATEALERPNAAGESVAPPVTEATLNALLGPLAPISPIAVPDPAAAAPASAPPVEAIAGRTSTPLEAAAAVSAEKFLAEAAGPTSAATERFTPTQLPAAPGITSPNGIPLAPVSAADAASAAPSRLLPVRQEQALEDIPEIYRGRMEQESGSHDAGSGATGETEEAVKSALAWLAANQSRDGRWDAERFGAGTERREIGPKGMPQDRGRAGVKADTGVTGLALLAFLGAGQTHLSGEHRETVRRGLDFLLNSQRADGNLGGAATTYAFMYCHGMATFALSEAYAITGDKRLETPVRRAIAYTLASQHPGTGGWRYRPGELGDMSQLGWQLMALKSASLAGIDVPQVALDRAAKFIRSVSYGTYGGLASYRPGEEGSRTMTAEALASRQFLGLAGDTPTAREAANYILEEVPGRGQANLYYWYYASLALHNLQGDSWDQWNAALRRELLESQEKSGPLAGSWPTDSLWSGYGGRVYTAAMGALCLEVYYRYLPIYLEASAKNQKVR